MDCSICGKPIEKEASGWDGGHNADPLTEGRCCGTCNDTKVLPARLEALGWSRPEQLATTDRLQFWLGDGYTE